jgi:hypothetical protein
MGEEVPPHAVLPLAMADDRFDGGAAFDCFGDAPFLDLGVDLELRERTASKP